MHDDETLNLRSHSLMNIGHTYFMYLFGKPYVQHNVFDTSPLPFDDLAT